MNSKQYAIACMGICATFFVIYSISLMISWMEYGFGYHTILFGTSVGLCIGILFAMIEEL